MTPSAERTSNRNEDTELMLAGGSSLEDEEMWKVLDRVRSGDRPPQHCLEEAQMLLLKKHDELKRETIFLIEAAANLASKQSSVQTATTTELVHTEQPATGGMTTTATSIKKSTATILVSKNKAKLPLLLKIK